MRICFYPAVFSLFASVGVVLVLLMSTIYVSPLQIVRNILITGGFAIAYAASRLWQRYWLIPVLGILQFLLFVLDAGGFLYPSGLLSLTTAVHLSSSP